MLWLLLTVLSFQSPPKPTINADFVWGQRHREHADNPVLITIDNPGATFEGKLVLRWADSAMLQTPRDNNPDRLEGAKGPRYEIPVTLPEKSRRRYFASVRGGQYDQDGLWICLRVGDAYVASWSPATIMFKPERPIVGQVGGAPIPGLGGATASCRAEDLPDQWHGYGLLHALVWLDADAAQVRDASVAEAIQQWVASGGHLVIARATTIGYAGTFLEQLAPVRVKGTASNDDWSELSRFVGGTAPDGRAAILDNARGLISTGTYGRGKVTFVAFDPCATPFVAWKGTPALWRWLLDVPPEPAEPEVGRVRSSDDWPRIDESVGSSNIRQLLSIHPEMPLPSLGWAFFLLAVYVILVGPVDYFWLRSKKRMELTWITFPSIVVLFSTVMLLAGATMTAHPPLARETAVVDVMPAVDVTCGHSLVSILTPESQVLRVSVAKPGAVVAPHAMMIRGAAEAHVRGARVDDWYFERGATGVASARWCEKGTPVRVKREGPHLAIRNDLGAPLVDAVFLHGGLAYGIGTVPVGESGHPLNPSGDWKSGVQTTARGPAPVDREHGYRSETEESLRWRMRHEMTWLGFTEGQSRGVAHTMNAAPWAAAGGGILMGWTEAGGVVRIEGASVRQVTDVFVRVFVNDD